MPWDQRGRLREMLHDIHDIVELVIPCIGRENNMPGGKNVDLVTVAAFGNVETSGALSIWCGSGSNL